MSWSGVGRVMTSNGSVPGRRGATVLRVTVARSLSKVRKLCTAIGSSLATGLGLCGFGYLGRCHDGCAYGFGTLAVLVVEQHGPELLAHVPFHVVGQHAQHDVGADSLGAALEDRADLQVYGLEAAEGPLHRTEAFVGAHATVGIEFGLRHAGAHHVQPIERRLSSNRRGVAPVPDAGRDLCARLHPRLRSRLHPCRRAARAR